MLTTVVTFSLLVFAAAVSGVQYTVPEPSIEAFSPKGLRVSIPDSADVKSVQFFLSFNNPVVENDPGTVSKEVDDKEGSYWIYWNPSVQLNPRDVVHYKLIVNNQDLYWSRQGSYVLDKVISLADNSMITAVDCDEDGGQQQLSSFPDLDNLNDKTLAVTGGQKNGLKSSYSMFKTIDSKPIVRSSTTSTSGTYVIKSTGDVEGSGYRTSSTYDSTRRDGDQWQHSKSDLSVPDLDELKRIHGQDFMGMPSYPSNIHTGGVGGRHAYSSYSSSSSSSSQSLPTIGSSGSYFQTTGQSANAQPNYRPMGGYKFSEYEEHQVAQANPVILTPAAKFSSSDATYIHTPVVTPVVTPEFTVGHTEFGPVPGTPLSGYNTVKTNYHKTETVKTTGPVVSSIPVSTTSVKKDSYDYSSAPKTSQPQPLKYTEATVYQGDIFRSSVRPTSPNSCQIADYGYKTASQIDVVQLERSLQEFQCLAVLAENSLKAEIRSLQTSNGNLVNRLQELEEKFRQFRNECHCGY